MLHARDILDAIFGTALGVAVGYGAVEGQLAACHRYRDMRRIDPGIVRQAIIGVLAYPVIRAGIVGRAAAAMILFTPAGRFLVAEPGSDFVTGTGDKAASALVGIAACGIAVFAIVITVIGAEAA